MHCILKFWGNYKAFMIINYIIYLTAKYLTVTVKNWTILQKRKKTIF